MSTAWSHRTKVITRTNKKYILWCQFSHKSKSFLQVFEGSEMVRMATLPDMWDRTITIGSAGKTFSVTGWKLGWAIGPQDLIRNCQVVHQNCVSTCPTPLQDAVARSDFTSQNYLDFGSKYFIYWKLGPASNSIESSVFLEPWTCHAWLRCQSFP